VSKRERGHFGDPRTRFFYELTPDRILSAVEAWGFEPTGRCLQLASMENRVYQIEVELDEPVKSANDAFRVVKFYRPGRWSAEQIREEHRFLLDLEAAEIPVVAPVATAGGETLITLPESGIFAALFPRRGGRAPDELQDEDLQRLGRLLARLHAIGATRPARARLRLDVDSYGAADLAYLLESGRVSAGVSDAYRQVVEAILQISRPWFEAAASQRIHGDCHRGNVLWGTAGPMLVDFDDMVTGPPVQDLWLLVPGRDPESLARREVLLAAYAEMNTLDRTALRLVEPLRALRVVHFSAWIARRYEDPAFVRVFPDFGSERYWYDELGTLREIQAEISQ
jgi:Ser/Thr protein kinase RdoA (MazF antagonist)